MDYRDLAIDRIHYLVERATELYHEELSSEAELLMEQAMEIAEDLRGVSQPLAA
jgi:hypothetical protein